VELLEAQEMKMTGRISATLVFEDGALQTMQVAVTKNVDLGFSGGRWLIVGK
jgi:hypothetical protein